MNARYVPDLEIPAARREKPPEKEYRWIGKNMKRVEDPRLLTGRGKYIDDVVLPNMAHAALLRSPHAHARIDEWDEASGWIIEGLSVMVKIAARSDGFITSFKNVAAAFCCDAKKPF